MKGSTLPGFLIVNMAVFLVNDNPMGFETIFREFLNIRIAIHWINNFLKFRMFNSIKIGSVWSRYCAKVRVLTRDGPSPDLDHKSANDFKSFSSLFEST